MTQLKKSKTFFSIGTMSGTSMDGIDVALIKTDGYFLIEEIANSRLEYPKSFRFILKAAEYAVRKQLGDLKKIYQQSLESILTEYAEEDLKLSKKIVSLEVKQAVDYLTKAEGSTKLNFQSIIKVSTSLHEQAIRQLFKANSSKIPTIDLVGYHGQTLFHDPSQKITIQIGDAEALAKNLSITVITDFRVNDVLAGGQGAPFAPLYHQALMVRDNVYPGVVINCGGIANVSVVKHLDPSTLIGFDTGPGNGLIDQFVKQKTGFKEVCDLNGRYGKQGKVSEAVLKALYNSSICIQGKNYFSLPIPKSLDIRDLQLIPELESLSFVDACRTLEAFTADSIVESLKEIDLAKCHLFILAGGGWHNPVIQSELKARVKEKLGLDIEVKTTSEMGWNNDALEAQIFAYLGVRSLINEPISLPNITGVPKPLTGGRAVSHLGV